MKKYNRKHKYAKRLKCLFGFIFIQIFITILFLLAMDASKPLDFETIEQIEICVDNVSYERVLAEYKFNIYSDSIKYTFSSSGIFQPYSNRELYETIEIGDRIVITYYSNRSLFGTYNWVVDARTESEIFRSIEMEEKSKTGAFIVIIVIFSIIEIAYLTILIVYIVLNHKTIKKNSKKKFIKKNPSKSRDG